MRDTVSYIAVVAPLSVADEKSAETAPSVTTPGLTAKEFAKVPGVIFARALTDVAGKNLVVVALNFPTQPRQQAETAPECLGHRHPGSTYIYVTKGAVRFGMAGQPVQVVHAGESFFELPGDLRTVTANVSATEPAPAIAVQVLPDGAPILTPDMKCGTL